MSKFYTYTIVGSGLMLLFYFMGLIEQTANSTLLNMLLAPSGLQNSSIADQGIVLLQGVAAVGAIVVGILTKNIEFAIKAPFAIYIFNLYWDILSVANVVAESNLVIAILIFAPVLTAYVLVTVEWFFGQG